jgi:subtilisin-like proprotein convertase family protein
MPVNVVTLSRTLGRPDSKFPAVPPQATGDQLLANLRNNWGLVGGHISRAEAAWLLALATHPNATTALKEEIAARAATATIGTAATGAQFPQWLAEMNGGAAPATPTPAPTSPTGSGALAGTLIPQDDKKVVKTSSHEISFASNQGGQWLPDMSMKRRDIADPEERATIATADLAGVTTASAFKAVLDAQLTTHKDFLKPTKTALFTKLPAADQSNYAVLNITGRRLEQFFNEMTRLVDRAGMSASEAKGARKEINIAYRDAFRGRAAEFDRADTGTYWSYGHDAPFVHVFEKMLEALPPGDPKRPFIQAQIDFIFENKYVPHGDVLEDNIEDSLELVAIDKGSRHVVSMTPDSDQSNSVRYETLQVKGGPNDGKYAFRDGTQYFVEGTRTELSAAEVSSLKRTPTSNVTFRRQQDGEQLRRNFRYDWDGNRMINAKEIDTGWWGHCDIKALIETILADMPKSRGVTEFRSDTGKTTEFSRDMQLEALAALLNFDDVYRATGGGGQKRFGQTNFAGGRNDDRPTTMKLSTDRGGSLNLPIRLQDLSDKTDPHKAVDVEKAFLPLVADAKNETFAANPDVRVDPNQVDTNLLDATGRKVGGTTDGYTFDDRGRPIEVKLAFELDPTASSGDKVLIGTQLTDIDGRKLDRYYYDPASKNVSVVPTSFVQESGKYVAKEGTAQVVGKLKGVELAREMQAGDDVQGKLAMLEEAVRTGRKIATDSDTGMQVWNGEVHSIKKTTEWRSPDGKWEREAVTIDATFGAGKVGSFLHKLDDEGRIVETMELKAAVDFYWADNPRIAPLISDRGNWWVNESMADRGVVDLGAGKQASLSAIQDLNDLIYLGLQAKDSKKLFTIVHQGKRYVYEDEAAWKADSDKLKAGVQPGGGTGGGTTDPNKIVSSRQANLSIPDGDVNGVLDALKIDRAGIIKDIKVDIDIKHTWIGDLDVVLIAPDGTNVKLHARGGRDKDDIVGTYGEGLNAVDDLKKLVGKDAKGDWQLKLVDLEGQDVGNLVSWGLKIDV